MPNTTYLNCEDRESCPYVTQIRGGSRGILVVKNSLHAPVLEDADYEQNYGEQFLALSEMYGKQFLHVSLLHPVRKQGV